jgi:branched-subunit amino acid aminotransferase/4-amino-4-deoxychorismate lyase
MLDHHVREARLAGFDDRLFVSRDGKVLEGTSWNVALWDGDQVVWPQAPVLRGVTMVLLQIAMTMNGTPWGLRPVEAADLTAFPAAAAVNSAGIRGIASVDEVPGTDARLVKVLAEAWAEVPRDEL